MSVGWPAPLTASAFNPLQPSMPAVLVTGPTQDSPFLPQQWPEPQPAVMDSNRNAVPVKFFTTGTAFRLRFYRFATAYRA